MFGFYWMIEYMQTAGISFRVFYKMGTEPLPLGLEMLISKLIFQDATDSLLSAANQVSSLAFYAPRKFYDWLLIRMSPWRLER